VVDDYAQTHRGRCPLPNGAIRLPTTHVYPPPHTAGCGIT
jgi:hypothetical protein